MPMAVKYCGKTRDQLNEILNFMCDVEDELDLNEDEQDKYDIALRCISTVMNRMLDRQPIDFEEDDQTSPHFH